MPKVKPLTEKQKQTALAKLPEWKLVRSGKMLQRTIETETPVAALAFCAKVLVHAEIQDHHPDMEISYKTVKLKLSTHDVKNITHKDVKLAQKIDTLSAK